MSSTQRKQNSKSTFEKLMLYLTKIHPEYSISDLTEALYAFRREQGTLAGLSLTQIENGVCNHVRKPQKIDIDTSQFQNPIEESVAAALWSTFKRYREEKVAHHGEPTNDDQCLICFEDLNSNKTETFDCQHTFHRHCLEEWFKVERTCPLCRKLLLFKDEFPTL